MPVGLRRTVDPIGPPVSWFFVTDPIFFATPAEFRAWLERNHATERELLVGFHNKATARPSLTWAEAGNIKRVAELEALGRMTPAGREVFARRSDDRSAVYSHEQRKHPEFEPEQQRRFEADAAAWAWFQQQPPSYRRQATHWVISAKRPETRERRLATLIADCAAGRTVRPLTRPG